MKKLLEKIEYVPYTCVWEITRACDLCCDHCGSSAGSCRSHELDTEEALDLVHQLASLGTRRLTLSGGEPTLREDWPLIARTASSRGIAVNMVTNGQGDADALAARALESGLSNIAVSIDGLEPCHDSIRRIGAFARATSAVEKLSRAGIWVDVMMTVNKKNLEQLPLVYTLSEQLGARGFRAQLGKPMGNQTERHDLTLQPKHLLELIPMLGQLARQPGPLINIGDSIGYFSPHDKALRGHCSSQGHWTGCYAGCRAVGIQSDGGVKGCLSLQPRQGEPDPFLEGYIRESSLVEIWNRPDAFAYNRLYEPQKLSGACAGCSYAELCRGGATCVSHAYTGKIGCDPMCYQAAMLEVGCDQKRTAWRQAASRTAVAMVLGLGLGVPACDDDKNTKSKNTDQSTHSDSDTATDTGQDTNAGTGLDTDTDTDADTGTDTHTDTGDGTDTVTVTDTVTDTGSEDECDSIDCILDYGNVPNDEYQACCCENVCCECDYGDAPPPGCCL